MTLRQAAVRLGGGRARQEWREGTKASAYELLPRTKRSLVRPLRLVRKENAPGAGADGGALLLQPALLLFIASLLPRSQALALTRVLLGRLHLLRCASEIS